MTIRIVAIGGTVNPGSTTEQALRLATRPAADAGAEVSVFGGEYLGALAHYRGTGYETGNGGELVEAVRAADGVIIAAPGYHGTISGLVKNALDYLEDLAQDSRPYLDGRAVGLITTASGDQASMGTLLTLRAIVHSLRGWPTPMGATIRTHEGLFSAEGEWSMSAPAGISIWSGGRCCKARGRCRRWIGSRPVLLVRLINAGLGCAGSKG